VEGCLACDLYEGRVDLPGGVIHDTGGWVVEHTAGPPRAVYPQRDEVEEFAERVRARFAAA